MANNRIAKKLAAILLAASLLAGGVPALSVFAETDESFELQWGIGEESVKVPSSGAALGAQEAGEVPSGRESLRDCRKAADIVRRMSVKERISQCFMVDIRYRLEDDGTRAAVTELTDELAQMFADYRFGAVILYADNIRETEGTLKLVKDLQAAAMEDGGLPMLIATDQEGGQVYRLGSGTALPGNMALGAAGDPLNAKLTGGIISRELGALGINTTLAPVVDVNSNANNPVIGIRSFSDDADTVGVYTESYIGGLRESGTIGCAKHFPGHGDSDTDSHTGLPVINRTLSELEARELKPFKAAIDSGVDMIMTSHILFPKVDDSKIYSTKTKQYESKPATMSKKILKDVLRSRLGFKGVIVTDAMDMEGVAANFSEEQATLEALRAGADMICVPVNSIYDKEHGYIYDHSGLLARYDSVIGSIEKAARRDPLLMARINQAAKRVVKLKIDRGILDYDADDYSIEKAEAAVGSDENRAEERKMASEAVTLVRNDGLLPYRAEKGSHILMLCPYNNERAQMVMGLNRAKASGVAHPKAEVRVYRFSSGDCEAKGELKNNIDWADLIIINSEVVDREDMALEYFTSKGVNNITEYCRAAGKRSVVMSVHNPYDVQLYPGADAVLAVYGCKGSTLGVTDELINGEITEDALACGPNITAGVEAVFGNCAISGRLPVAVPVFDNESKTFTEAIAFERGFGLESDALEPLPAEDEEQGGSPEAGEAKTETLKKAVIKSARRGRRCIKIKLSATPAARDAEGYRIAYRAKGAKKWRYVDTGSDCLKIKKLKKGRRYLVKARLYKTVDGKRVYGKWSKTKKTGRVR